MSQAPGLGYIKVSLLNPLAFRHLEAALTSPEVVLSSLEAALASPEAALESLEVALVSSKPLAFRDYGTGSRPRLCTSSFSNPFGSSRLVMASIDLPSKTSSTTFIAKSLRSDGGG